MKRSVFISNQMANSLFAQDYDFYWDIKTCSAKPEIVQTWLVIHFQTNKICVFRDCLFEFKAILNTQKIKRCRCN